MRVVADSLTVAAPEGPPLGLLVVAPDDAAPYPGLLFYTDIFGRNPASVRMMMRFASYGHTVVAPDLYRRLEPIGVALDFTADYGRAQRDANATEASAFDADRALALGAMATHPRVARARVAAVGFCIGGHLALRAAVEPSVECVVAYYPTGVHDGELGASHGTSTLGDLREVSARLYLAFGSLDPHTDEPGRTRVADVLGATAERVVTTFPGEHAFMRDEGPRYDAAVTDRAFAAGLAWIRARG